MPAGPPCCGGLCGAGRAEKDLVLNTEIFVAVYYLGFGFLIFLGWMCILDASGPPVDQVRRNRLHRLAVGLATVGLVHPAFALAGRDLAAQLGRVDGPYNPKAASTLRITTWGLAVALTVAVLVVAAQLGPLGDAPVFRQIRSALPFR